MPLKGSPTANCRSLCHGLVWLKQGALVWVVLLCAFLAGGSAGGFLFDPCRRLDRWSGSGADIEGHQAILSNQSGDFAGVEIDQSAHVYLHAFIDQYRPFVYAADRTMIGVRTDDAQKRLAPFKAVSDSNLDLSVLIAQRHAVSRFKIAFVIRRLYIFQNQFNSIALFSCLSMRQIGTSAREFGSISCRSPLVLSAYSVETLVWARQSSQVQNQHCAATATARSQPRNLSPQHGGGLSLTI
jgi:hypothetical protein